MAERKKNQYYHHPADKEQNWEPLIYSQEPKSTQMYVNVDGPFSSTPPATRKSLFGEFSGGGGAASLFNLRQKRSVICAEGRGGGGAPAGCFVRGFQLSE